MPDKLATTYIWITMLVTAFAIVLMLVTGKPEEPLQEQMSGQSENVSNRSFYEKTQDLTENAVRILLPTDVKEQHVTIENDYMEKTMRFVITKQPEGTLTQEYFYKNPLSYNTNVTKATLTEDEGQIVIALALESLYEWEMKYEKEVGQNILNVQLVRPRDKYEKIVVLDAGHGGNDAGSVVSGVDEATDLTEKDLALSVVTKAGQLLEKEGICVYYTRDEDENPSLQQRVALANEAQADMLISIHADYDEDTSVYGMRTVYNENYFIPKFASADLAYLVLEKVAASTNEKAIGFEPGTGDMHLVQGAMIPVTQLYIGYLSNKQEQKLLKREDYIDRIAAGIYDAVMAGYEEIEK